MDFTNMTLGSFWRHRGSKRVVTLRTPAPPDQIDKENPWVFFSYIDRDASRIYSKPALGFLERFEADGEPAPLDLDDSERHEEREPEVDPQTGFE